MLLSKTLGLLVVVAVARATTCEPYDQKDYQKDTWSIRAYEKLHCEDVIGTIDIKMSKKDFVTHKKKAMKRTPNKCYPIKWKKKIGSVHGFDQKDYTVAIFKDSNCQQRIKRYRPEKSDHPFYWEPKEQGAVKSYMFTYPGSPPRDGTWPRQVMCLESGRMDTGEEKAYHEYACEKAREAGGKHGREGPEEGLEEWWGNSFARHSCLIRTPAMQKAFSKFCGMPGEQIFKCMRTYQYPGKEGPNYSQVPCNSKRPNLPVFEKPKYDPIKPLKAKGALKKVVHEHDRSMSTKDKRPSENLKD